MLTMQDLTTPKITRDADIPAKGFKKLLISIIKIFEDVPIEDLNLSKNYIDIYCLINKHLGIYPINTNKFYNSNILLQYAKDWYKELYVKVILPTVLKQLYIRIRDAGKPLAIDKSITGIFLRYIYYKVGDYPNVNGIIDLIEKVLITTKAIKYKRDFTINHPETYKSIYYKLTSNLDPNIDPKTIYIIYKFCNDITNKYLKIDDDVIKRLHYGFLIFIYSLWIEMLKEPGNKLTIYKNELMERLECNRTTIIKVPVYIDKYLIPLLVIYPTLICELYSLYDLQKKNFMFLDESIYEKLIAVWFYHQTKYFKNLEE